MQAKDQKSEDFWKNKLSPEVFKVCRLKGTEPPFSGKYNDMYEKGVYHCAACSAPLFSSETKFHSGSGWPSFWNFAVKDDIKTQPDESGDMVRTEVLCAQCDSHLGHMFEDLPAQAGGPEPTGLRYCINSLALNFIPDSKQT